MQVATVSDQMNQRCTTVLPSAESILSVLQFYVTAGNITHGKVFALLGRQQLSV